MDCDSRKDARRAASAKFRIKQKEELAADPKKKEAHGKRRYQRDKAAGAYQKNKIWRQSPAGKAHLKAYNERWNAANPTHRLQRKLNFYGMTMEHYERLFESQKGACAICKQPETEMFNRVTHGELKKSLTIDHHHLTGAVRGLLCGKCNKAIGLLKDSAAIAASAAKYLERLGLFAGACPGHFAVIGCARGVAQPGSAGES